MENTMYSCPKCEHLVTFDHYGEPHCPCNSPRRAGWGVALMLLGAMVMIAAMVSCHHKVQQLAPCHANAGCEQ